MSTQALDHGRESARTRATNAVAMTASTLMREMVKVVKVKVESSKAALAQLPHRRSGLDVGTMVGMVEAMMQRRQQQQRSQLQWQLRQEHQPRQAQQCQPRSQSEAPPSPSLFPRPGRQRRRMEKQAARLAQRRMPQARNHDETRLETNRRRLPLATLARETQLQKTSHWFQGETTRTSCSCGG